MNADRPVDQHDETVREFARMIREGLSKPQTTYEGGLPIKDGAGDAKCVSRFGQVYVSFEVQNEAGFSKTTMELSADEADELAGALQMAAAAARNARER